MKNDEKRNIKILYVFFFLLIIINLNFLPKNGICTSFNVLNPNHPHIFEVSYYNEELWNSTIGIDSGPDFLFRGETEVIGARAKIVNDELDELISYPLSIFDYFFFEQFDIPYDSLLEPNGYNGTFIEDIFIDDIFTWEWRYYSWNFTTGYFDDYAITKIVDGEKHSRIIRYKHITLQDPSDYSKIMQYYENYTNFVNNDSNITATNYTLPNISGYDLLWALILNGFIIASPYESYLNQMVSSLNCSEVTVLGKSLKFVKTGNTNYSVEITFNDLGSIDSLLVKSSNNKLIYRIISEYPQHRVYLLLVIMLGINLGIGGLYIYYKFRQKKEIEKDFRQ